MQHMLNLHPYGMVATYLWRRYRETPRLTFNPRGTYDLDHVENDPTTVRITESRFRSVSYPGGSGIQTINAEPTGEPFLSLHQNHYYIPTGMSLGAINFCSQDNIGVTLRANVDGEWTTTDRPTSFAINLTKKDSATPVYRALSINSSGAVHIGGEAENKPQIVSFGIYRDGALQLPKVDSSSSLDRYPPTDGLMFYLKDKNKIVVSEGGLWKQLVTEKLTI